MKKSHSFRFARPALATTLTLGALMLATTACSPFFGVMRDQTAQRIAAPAWMSERQTPAGPFVLTLYERVHQDGAPITIYIEGDGLAWVSRTEPSLDPTPTNPVALQLAAHDNATNVIYMARPCQYSKMTDGSACSDEYWTNKRFAPEVIDSMNKALDDIKTRYRASGFNLVGYSGGGAVAVLLAARRDDVLSLRTVAGNIDPNLFSAIHNVSPLTGSLNPLDVAPKTAHIPQRHFIGAWDEIVTPALYDSFKAAVGPSTCLHSSIIVETDHDSGWVNKWPDLLKEPLDCSK